MILSTSIIEGRKCIFKLQKPFDKFIQTKDYTEWVGNVSSDDMNITNLLSMGKRIETFKN